MYRSHVCKLSKCDGAKKTGIKFVLAIIRYVRNVSEKYLSLLQVSVCVCVWLQLRDVKLRLSIWRSESMIWCGVFFFLCQMPRTDCVRTWFDGKTCLWLQLDFIEGNVLWCMWILCHEIWISRPWSWILYCSDSLPKAWKVVPSSQKDTKHYHVWMSPM